MLQYQSNSIVVVPPMQAVWLSQDNQQGRFCLSFDVKTDTDACVLFKPEPGSKRWQELQKTSPSRGAGPARPEYEHVFRAAAAATFESASFDESCGAVSTEPGYLVVIGSHRNSRIKIERNGRDTLSVPWRREADKLSPACFKSYWVSLEAGTLAVGIGRPDSNDAEALCVYRDPEPLQGLRSCGLAAWDSHMAFKRIRFHPSAPTGGVRASLAHGEAGPHSLFDLAARSIAKHVSPATVAGILDVAAAMLPVTQSLLSSLSTFAATYLPQVVAEDPVGWAALPSDVVLHVLRHPDVTCPEMGVFWAVVVWACGGAEGPAFARPEAEVTAALQYVRFPQMDEAELQSLAASPLAQVSAALRDLLAEAGADCAGTASLGGVASPGCGVGSSGMAAGGPGAGESRDRTATAGTSGRDAAVLAGAPVREGARQGPWMVEVDDDPDKPSALRRRKRLLPGMVELLYIHDGDMNGVVAFLGTSCGRGPFINPAVTGRIAVSASSPQSRLTDYKALVSRNFARQLSAGPRVVGGSSETWWALDLGQNTRLACNCYTIRHDESDGYLRSWCLQGSNDRVVWTTLRQHVDDGTICVKGQFASFPVTGAASRMPFRHFRLLMLGPHAHPQLEPPWHMHVCNWELYGYAYLTQRDKLCLYPVDASADRLNAAS